MIGRIIYLTADDDAQSVRDRIEWANAARVALVMPKERHKLLSQEVDIERIKRAGQQCGSEVAIISPSLSERMQAREIGLVTFRTADQAIQRKWLPNEDVEPIQRQREPRRFVPHTLRRFLPRRNWLMMGVRFVMTVATLAIMAAAGLVLVPTARVTLTATSQPISLIVPITLDPQASKPDLEKQIIPAQRIDVIVEDVASTPTTGAKDIPRGKAGGTIVLLNVLPTPYTVPKNTVVRTSSASVAVRFVTLNDIEVPPAGKAEVAIQAIDEGPGGNVPAEQINRVEGLPALAVRVINLRPTQGGGIETVRAVTQDDYQRARAALQDKLLQEALDKMQQQSEVVRNALYIVPNTLFIADVQDETYDRFLTEQANEVKLSMRLQVAGLAVAPADLDAVASALLSKKVPPGFSLLEVDPERGDVAEEGTGSRTEFFITARGIAGAEIDPNEVKKLVRGKTIADAQSALLQKLSLKGNPRIEVEPDWLFKYTNRLPFVTLRIETTVKRE
jgi:hypothetical protein